MTPESQSTDNPVKTPAIGASDREARFRELAALLPETVYEMDASGRFTYVNDKALEQFGYSRADFEAGANALDMIVPEDHQRAVENIARALAGQRVYHSEYTCLRKDGSTFPGLFYSAVRYREGQPAGILGIIIDNSHQKALEQRLREREIRYRMATEAGLAGVWDHDLQTGRMVIDASLKHLLGFGDDDITRWDAWQARFHPDDVAFFMDESRRYIKGLIPRYEVKGRIVDNFGQVRWILVRAVAERDGSGRVRRMIGTATDITRLRQVETELETAKSALEARVSARTHALRAANRALREVVRDKLKTARALKQREAELETKTAKLQDLNTALRYLLKKLDREKNEFEEKMMADLRDLVHPYLKKLIRRSREREVHALATILDNHLKAIVSPFSRYLTSPALNLTPAELNVAHMVKSGKTTRQIADILNVAYKTVETHRVNIRRKLGLTGKSNNLRTCLMALEKPVKSIRDI
jgi:PAS domain S-box-containing protein